MSSDKRPLSAKEAAAELGKHPETVRRWLREEAIDGVRPGGRGAWLVPAREVDRLKGED